MAKKEKKRDLRDGMLERGPVASSTGATPNPETPEAVDEEDILRPGSHPLAEGQTTHQ
jgi:hypothetical protein